MADMREELVQKIERARQQLNQNVDTEAAYNTIYSSVWSYQQSFVMVTSSLLTLAI